MMAIGDSFGRTDDGRIYETAGMMLRGNLGDAGPAQTGVARKRHRGRLNAVFCDGHVEGITLQRLFLDKADEALRRWNRDNEPHRERLIRQEQLEKLRPGSL
ncbi:MAG: hypothetical protein FJ398_14730 [Verrucomicrobia bacterium]|nr:hypothetical protein [Verrucomicrobiota bacterium]